MEIVVFVYPIRLYSSLVLIDLIFVPGLLLFGREHYYVVDGYTLLKTREIRDLNFLPEELHDPIIPYTACGGAVRIKGLRRM